MVYYSIKEVAEITGLSVSTVKRRLKKVKAENPKIYASKGNLKYEQSKTGSPKILISKSFLSKHIEGEQGVQSEPLSEPLKEAENQDIISFLKSQLEKKDQQIETLLERNKEINLLFAQSQQNNALRLEEDTTKKKRWWQRS